MNHSNNLIIAHNFSYLTVQNSFKSFTWLIILQITCLCKMQIFNHTEIIISHFSLGQCSNEWLRWLITYLLHTKMVNYKHLYLLMINYFIHMHTQLKICQMILYVTANNYDGMDIAKICITTNNIQLK